MNCEQIREEIVAFLKGEADSNRQEINAHLEKCDACRGIFEGCRAALAAAASIGEISPSPGFMSELKRKLARARSGRSSARRLSATIRPRRALIQWRWVSAAAAVILMALGASSLILFPKGKSAPVAADPERAWNERRVVVKIEREMRGGAIDVSGVFAANSLWLVPHEDAKTGERCVVAYTEEEMAGLKVFAESHPEIREDLRKVLEKAEPATVSDGLLSIPPGLLSRCLSLRRVERTVEEIAATVQILKLEGRTEIWASPVLTRYLEVKPVRIVPSQKQG